MSIIIGRKPVLEAINSGEELEQVFILYGQRGGIIDAIRIAANKRGIKCNEVKLERFKTITQNPNAQGVAAKKSSQKYFSLQEIIDQSKKSTFLKSHAVPILSGSASFSEIPKSPLSGIPLKAGQIWNDTTISSISKPVYPLILVLDSIQDPHNLGAILRTAECAGANGVIITKHNSASINETVIKTSAGATEHLKICPVNNLSQTLKELKANGFWIVGSALENAKDYTKVDYKIPLVLVVGNEEKGIRRLTAESCDFIVEIPMKGKIQSLNVSVAAGILLFEILRQRSQ